MKKISAESSQEKMVLHTTQSHSITHFYLSYAPPVVKLLSRFCTDLYYYYMYTLNTRKFRFCNVFTVLSRDCQHGTVLICSDGIQKIYFDVRHAI